MISLKVKKRFYFPFIFIFLFGYISAALFKNVDVNHVYGILPVYTIYTEKFLDKETVGTNKGILNIMKFKDKEVLAHELIHSKQAYRTLYLTFILSRYSESYRAKCEAEAYALIITSEIAVPIFAKMIQEEYAPSISIEKIEGYIRNYL